MKTLLILRHAKSSWKHANLGDHDRPLNSRGKGDAPLMGDLLRHENLVPDIILSSSAKRALSTAIAVAEACSFDDDVQVARSFYHAGPDTYYEVISQIPDDVNRVLIVGHNPGLEDLLEDVSGQWERLPTAALAQVKLPIDAWSEIDEQTEGKLINIWRPRELFIP